MPTLRVLTVDLTDLNLDASAINGSSVEISIERAATFDSFVIAPSLNYKSTSDGTGVLQFNILPNDANTVYRANVVDGQGSQVLSALFTMPDADSSLADLIALSYFPDGFNPPENGVLYSFNSQPGSSYALQTSDVTVYGRLVIEATNNSGCAITCGTPVSLAKGVGQSCVILQAGLGAVSLSPGSGASIHGKTATSGQGDAIILIARSATDWRAI